MLPTIDSKSELFSFLGEIHKAQRLARNAEAFLDDYIQNLDRFPDREKTKGSVDIELEMEKLEEQMELLETKIEHLIEVYPGDLPERLFQRLGDLRDQGADFAGGQSQPDAYLSLDDARLCSNHLQGVHKALRALVHFLETECELQRAEPIPTLPIVSPTAPATESADPKPTESKPKAKKTGRKGRPPAFTMAEGIQALEEDRTRLGWSGKQWGHHFGCSKSTVIASDFWDRLKPLKCQSRMDKAPPNKSTDRIF